jgi:hypothetical protein
MSDNAKIWLLLVGAAVGLLVLYGLAGAAVGYGVGSAIR